MSDKKPTAVRVGENGGLVAGQFLAALVVMFALHLLHRDAHAIPALGYWSVFWSVVGIYLVAFQIGDSVARKSKRG